MLKITAARSGSPAAAAATAASHEGQPLDKNFSVYTTITDFFYSARIHFRLSS